MSASPTATGCSARSIVVSSVRSVSRNHRAPVAGGCFWVRRSRFRGSLVARVSLLRSQSALVSGRVLAVFHPHSGRPSAHAETIGVDPGSTHGNLDRFRPSAALHNSYAARVSGNSRSNRSDTER